ncbi:oligosaccharide flippase family protein [Capnocytophaga periodontitidis]|uniref:oligosaccharide flippase family protein n=1 Tax=Capnocytophaga periodontitidis TaxID=2795027 RepID=UPI0018E1D1D7|nr:oligosaccharide flippase family protein [Capnocytophaga periodontitidis]MBI1669652.1 oligosaccharide flippase family protein [Capnocytophaga periodontitidis]
MRRLLKDSTIYLIGEIISKIIPFLLIPYLSRKLGVAGYGELSYYQTYTALFVILFGLVQEGSVTRYFYFYGKNALDLIVRTGYLYTICIASLSFLICLFFKSEILLYLVLAAVFEVFVTVQLSIRQCQKQAFSYVVIQILSGVLSLSITIFLLEFFQTNLVEKRILAILTSNALVFVISYFFLYRTKVKKRKFSFNNYKTAFLYILSLGLPMIFHHLSFYIKGQVDRIFIYHKFTETDLGLYAMGANIAMILITLIGAINKATVPYYYEAIKKNGISLQQIHKWALISLLIPIIISSIISIIPESLILWFLGNQFLGTKYYIVIFSITATLAIPYALLVNYLFYYGKNKQIAFCSILSTLIYIVALICLTFTDIKYIPFASILAALSILPILYFYTKKIDLNNNISNENINN